MIRYSSEVTIARPPREVFDTLLDPERYAQWTDMVHLSLDTADRPKVGTRGRFRLTKGPIKGMLDFEVTELEPDRRVVFRVTHPSLDWRSVAALEPAGTGTRMTYAGEIRLHGWRRLLEPLVAGEVRRGEAGEAQRLKELLEGHPDPAAVTA